MTYTDPAVLRLLVDILAELKAAVSELKEANQSLDNLYDKVDDILANDRGTYNP